MAKIQQFFSKWDKDSEKYILKVDTWPSNIYLKMLNIIVHLKDENSSHKLSLCTSYQDICNKK